jgi:hypothetical protein
MTPVLTAMGTSDFAGPYGLRASRSFVLERRSFVDRPRSELLWRSTLGVPLPVSSIPKIMHKNKMTMSFIASLPRHPRPTIAIPRRLAPGCVRESPSCSKS